MRCGNMEMQCLKLKGDDSMKVIINVAHFLVLNVDIVQLLTGQT